MCQFDDGFKLCTCDTNTQSDSQQEGYLWEVRTLLRMEWAQGRCSIPAEDIGDGLVHEWVELNLNCEPCFDFDYQPADGDNLLIYKGGESGRYPYLSFMYKAGVWGEGHYDEISEIPRRKLKGKVKTL